MIRRVIPPLCCFLFFIAQAKSQSSSASAPSEAAAAHPPSYEVVSIREVKNAPPMAAFGDTPDGFSMRNLTLEPLISEAYDLREDQVSGWPKWATSMRFDIEAKMDAEHAAAMQKLPREQQQIQRQLMLQALLADRFQLKVHPATAMRTNYELVLAKSGLKMKKNDSPTDMDGKPWQEGVRPATDWQIYEGKITGHAMPIFVLADHLGGAVDSTVVDKTGLAGRYDVLLHWNPSDMQNSDSTEPSLFSAIEEQLGLQLKPVKTAVNTIVIDRLEMPSPN